MSQPPEPPAQEHPSDGSEPAAPFRERDGGRIGLVLVVVAVLLVVGLWTVTLAGRVLRAPPAPLALAVTLLPYLYVAVAGGLFLMWVALPDRRILPAALGGVLVSGGLLWGPSWPARSENAAGAPVRVMTWNVRRLWGWTGDGGDATQCVVQTVREADPDLLALLEVSQKDVDDLSAALGLRCVHVDYLGSGSDRAGGLAACARGDDWHLVNGEPQRYRDTDAWRYVFTEMSHDGRVLNLLAVHLAPYYPDLSHRQMRANMQDLAHGEPGGLLGAGRSGEEIVRAQGAQSSALLARVGRFRDPTVVVGDFNSTRDAALHTALRRVLTDAWERGGVGFGATTRLGGWLPLRIDYVYVTRAFAVRDAHVPARDCSDHRPVVADLVWRDAR